MMNALQHMACLNFTDWDIPSSYDSDGGLRHWGHSAEHIHRTALSLAFLDLLPFLDIGLSPLILFYDNQCGMEYCIIILLSYSLNNSTSIYYKDFAKLNLSLQII